MFKKNFLWLLLAAVLLSSCTSQTEDPRAHLERLNIPYTEDAFVQAAAEGNVQALEYFLDAGMEPNVLDTKGDAALTMAAKQGQKECVTFLLNQGAYLEIVDRDFEATPLIWATLKSQAEIVRLLLDVGADTTRTEGKNGMRALHIAAVRGDNETIKLLLDANADINARDNDDRTPLMWAVHHRHLHTVKFLAERGANLDLIETKSGMSVLGFVIARGDSEMIKLLLDLGADMNISSEEGKTALMLAAFTGRIELVKLLLENGADINVVWKKNGLTPFLAAAVRGHVEVIKILLDAGTDLESSDEKGRTALIWAANSNQSKMVEFLLDQGANIEAKERIHGMTALMAAASKDYIKPMAVLLDRGADIEAKSKDGKTPLLVAVFVGQPEAVELLIERGANVKALDDRGTDAFSYIKWSKTKRSHKEKIRELLKNAGDSDELSVEQS